MTEYMAGENKSVMMTRSICFPARASHPANSSNQTQCAESNSLDYQKFVRLQTFYTCRWRGKLSKAVLSRIILAC
eukprot:scaffold452494_cov18-Prasinocladus_malaysianus.AAC.1